MDTERQPTSENAAPFARSIPATPWQAPNRSAALDQYRRRAQFYDLQLALAEPIRRRAIERLGLKGGETVLDVGCGTGLSFELLEQRVGREGKIIGIEQSSDMIDQARARADRDRFENVTPITCRSRTLKSRSLPMPRCFISRTISCARRPRWPMSSSISNPERAWSRRDSSGRGHGNFKLT